METRPKPGFISLITIWNVALRRDLGKWRVQERVFGKGDCEYKLLNTSSRLMAARYGQKANWDGEAHSLLYCRSDLSFFLGVSDHREDEGTGRGG